MTEGAHRPSDRMPEQHLGFLSTSVHSSPAFQPATWTGAGRTVGSLGNDRTSDGVAMRCRLQSGTLPLASLAGVGYKTHARSTAQSPSPSHLPPVELLAHHSATSSGVPRDPSLGLDLPSARPGVVVPV